MSSHIPIYVEIPPVHGPVSDQNSFIFRVAFLSQKIETTKATDGKEPAAFMPGCLFAGEPRGLLRIIPTSS